MLCLDKTGTITTGKLEVVDVIGVNDTEKERVEAVMNEMAFAFDDVNNTQDALMKYFKKSSRWRPLEKIPFSSDRKYRAIRYDQEGCFCPRSAGISPRRGRPGDSSQGRVLCGRGLTGSASRFL